MQLAVRPFALFENNLAAQAEAILLETLEQAICAYTANEYHSALEQVAAAQARGAWVALAAHYELGSILAPHLVEAKGQPLLRAWIFSSCQQLKAQALEAWWQTQLADLTPQQREAGLLKLSPAWDEDRHARASTRILDYIHNGDCYQTNLTFPLHGQSFGHPLALAARLRESQAVAHGALICDGERWIISRSPELFFTRQGDTLTCRPMKGTALRGDTAETDASVAAALLASKKDQAENLMIVDLIRNDLGRLAPPGGVRVERLFELETYTTVHQLTSTVHAQPVSADLAHTLEALFPCGSVTGAPKIRAMQIIEELEDSPRGLYCGALGWLAPDGNMSLNVPIRTVLLDAAGTCCMNVGSGIVADSDPAAEYKECLAKARFFSRLGDDLKLIETLRWAPDTGYPMLEGHLSRLEQSAKALHFKCERATIRQSLAQFAHSQPAELRRIRLLLDREGHCQLEAFSLDAPPANPSFTLADWALDPLDPRLQHKTTARSFYDTALRGALQQGHFDIVFCNTRGELCEGARSTLFLEIDGMLWTPPLHCGLLPGVLRAEMLASGRACECILYPQDLQRAQRIYLGNALRGLTEVALQNCRL